VSLAIALLTVSSRHTIADDTSGDALQQRLEAAGHRLVDRHWWVTTATASGPR
jgi:molybdenum cofactor biosynthesis protein B